MGNGSKYQNKYTIEDAHRLASEHEGKFLSAVFTKSLDKYEWQCKLGHRWIGDFRNVLRGSWCPHCAHKAPLTIEYMHELAKVKSGKCLSTKYTNVKTKLLWECEKGHQWWATPNGIIHNRWCDECGGTKTKTLEYVQELAKKRGGKLITTEYVNLATKMLWECELGHQWWAKGNSISNGDWCHDCRYYDLEDMQELAKKNNGICLSTEYIRFKDYLEWQCEKGHVFKAKPVSIINNRWCQQCNSWKYSIEDCQEIAIFRGGKCLSTEYVNCKRHLLWECNKGHQWPAKLDNIVQGKWCPACYTYFNENLCREILEELLNDKFPSVKPDWLKNLDTKNNLQLDGYCSNLNLAFEYNGLQHYKPVNFGTDEQNSEARNSETRFKNQKRRDKLKKKLCKELNIKLITIPCFENGNLQEFILSELNRLNINPVNKQIDLEKIKQKLYKQEII